MSRSESDKAKIELKVFHEFTKMCCLEIDEDSIEKSGLPSFPDITCRVANEGEVAFELVELCNNDIALATSDKAIKKFHDNQPSGSEAAILTRTSDNSVEIIRNKLNKKYKTAMPIELICYLAGSSVTPDDVIIASISPWFDAKEGPFRRAWLLSEKRLYVVWPYIAEAMIP